MNLLFASYILHDVLASLATNVSVNHISVVHGVLNDCENLLIKGLL